MRYIYLSLAALLTFCCSTVADAQDWARHGAVKDTMFAYSQAQTSTVDITGNAYITGIMSAPFMAFGTDTVWADTTGNMPIVKYDRLGNVLWVKNLTGGGSPSSMASDLYGNVYVAGMYLSDSLTLGGYTLHKIDSAWNFFLFKLDASGTVIWGKSGDMGRVTNLGYDHSTVSVALDTAHHVFLVAGYSTNSITLDGMSLTNSAWGKLEGMLAKYDTSGTLLWLKGVAGSDDDYIMASAADKAGNIFTGGAYKSPTLDYGTVSVSATPGTWANGFLTKQDPSGNALWSRSFPSTFHSVNSMNAGDDGSIYFTGYFENSTIFETTTLNVLCTGNGYLAKYSPTGDLNWVKQVENGLTLFSAISPVTKNIWICGRFGYSSGSYGCAPYAIIAGDTLMCPVTSPGPSNPNFIAEIDTAGNLVYATAYTSGGFITNVSVDTAGYVLYTGTYMGPDPFVIAGDTLPIAPAGMFMDQAYFFAARMAPHPPITGGMILCAGNTDILANISPGGAWSSSDTDVVTVDTAGVITGVGAGTATITYDYAAGSAFAVATITVNATAITGGITGDSTVCEGAAITLSAVAGGAWSASNSSATVVGGTVTGVTAGIDTISYSISSTCGVEVATKVVSVNASPSAISGVLSVCAGDTVALTSSPSSGSWFSSDTAIGTVDTVTGMAAGVLAGTITISYVIAHGCMSTALLTVDPLPSMITGSLALCAGTTSLLASVTAGGTWSSSNTAVGTINSGGNLDGLTAGTTTISYILSTGCAVSDIATVNPVPAAVSGLSSVCAGSVTTYTDVTAGGIWSSSNTSVGTIDAASGVLAGLVAGTTLVLYSLPTGCSSYQSIVVNPLPAPITGVLTVCALGTTTLSSTTAGGTWTSGAGTVASIGSLSGIASGLTPGTSTINYRLPTGCFVTAVLTVDALPVLGSSLTPPAICDSTLFSYTPASASPGATFAWSRATITGILPMASSGTDDPNEVLDNTTTGPISVTYVYTVTSGGCSGTSSVVVVVNPYPVLSGSLTPPAICDSTTFSYTPASLTSGASFSWSRAFVAGIGALPSSGSGNPSEILNNITNSPVTVTYVYTVSAAGCSSVQSVAVVVQPTPLLNNTLPPAPVCSGTPFSFVPTSLTSGVTYAWMRSVVGGISNPPTAGTGSISETLINTTSIPLSVVYQFTLAIGGCTHAQPVTVMVNPPTNAGAISGPDTVCVGASIALTDAVTGGTWSTNNSNVMVAAGIVTGVTAGTTTVSYSVPGVCGAAVATKTVTILPASACTTEVPAISGGGGLVVFPNPNSGEFTVKLASPYIGDVNVVITNVVGQKVYEFATATNTEKTVRLHVASGIYLLTAVSGSDKYVVKLEVR